MESVLFGIDLGNRQIKASDGKNTFVMPSSLISVDKLTGFGKDPNESLVQYVIDGKSYYVGSGVKQYSDKAIGSLELSASRYENNVAFKFLAIATVAGLARAYSSARKGELKVALMIGLPSEDFNNDRNIENVKKIYRGSHTVECMDGNDRITIKFIVNDVYVVPQSYGSFVSLAYSGIDMLTGEAADEDFEKMKEYMSSKVALVDIGGGTVLLDTVEYGNVLVKESTQLPLGARILYDNIKEKINQTPYNIGGVDVNKVEMTVRKGIEDGSHHFVYKVNKNLKVDISEAVNDAISEWSLDISFKMRETFKNLDTYDEIIFTGGGANIIDKSIIDDNFNVNYNRTVYLPNSETANVEGYVMRLQAMDLE
ncbi:ParM/StbA family protein [Ligilactobacillus faecis]|uniref:ParM/StbA family protein n=1 Tax=Ligilactobacillus faecis TaxID=762833 RepID=A0ABV4DM18_9LACO